MSCSFPVSRRLVCVLAAHEVFLPSPQYLLAHTRYQTSKTDRAVLATQSSPIRNDTKPHRQTRQTATHTTWRAASPWNIPAGSVVRLLTPRLLDVGNTRRAGHKKFNKLPRESLLSSRYRQLKRMARAVSMILRRRPEDDNSGKITQRQVPTMIEVRLHFCVDR